MLNPAVCKCVLSDIGKDIIMSHRIIGNRLISHKCAVSKAGYRFIIIIRKAIPVAGPYLCLFSVISGQIHFIRIIWIIDIGSSFCR